MASFTAYELTLACKKPDCPVCRLEQKSVQQYMEGLLYESVNSPSLRNRLRVSHGFCNEHAWLAIDNHLGDALGFAIIYHDVINSVLRQLDADAVHLPGIYVQRVLPLTPEQVADKRIEKRTVTPSQEV